MFKNNILKNLNKNKICLTKLNLKKFNYNNNINKDSNITF